MGYSCFCTRKEISKRYNITLLGIDHHKTNNLNDKYNWFKVYKEKNYDDVRFPDGVKVSAAWALMNYISTVEDVTPPSTISLLIDMISRYDTWEWKNHPYNYIGAYEGIKEDVTAVICGFMGPEKTFKELYDLYMSDDSSTYIQSSLKKTRPKIKKLYPDLFKTIYDIEKAKETRCLEKVYKKIRIVDLFKYTVAIVIADMGYTNAVADYINNQYQFVDMVIILYPTSNRLGFRTKSDKIDVAAFAEKYFNGGGHPKASGALVDDSTMSSFMELYYIIGDTVEDYCENNELMKGVEDKVV